jgi:hypothetical protein
VLDSIRLLVDKKLDQNIKKIIDSIKIMWEEYYADSRVKIQTFELEDIKPPK